MRRRPPLVLLAALAAAGGPLGCTLEHVLVAPRDLAAALDAAGDPAAKVDAEADAPPPQEFAFCPTTIDVYGDEDALFPGCGGPGTARGTVAGGYFAPGTMAYDATLAGRLQSRLAADPELVALFGRTWKVRSCAAPGLSLAAMSAAIDADRCGAPTAPAAMGTLLDQCTETPGKVVLLLASNQDDGCHGGSARSPAADDKLAYGAHFATRLAAFLDARRSGIALVGPRTEWYQDPGGPPPTDDGGVSGEACAWRRGDWDEGGVRQWQALGAGTASVFPYGHLHDESRQHHPCCAALGVACLGGWFTDGPHGPTLLNGDGCQALLDFWYARIKKTLLGNRFHCG